MPILEEKKMKKSQNTPQSETWICTPGQALYKFWNIGGDSYPISPAWTPMVQTTGTNFGNLIRCQDSTILHPFHRKMYSFSWTAAGVWGCARTCSSNPSISTISETSKCRFYWICEVSRKYASKGLNKWLLDVSTIQFIDIILPAVLKLCIFN